ncbi:MAG TPA: Asp23/Gls24 family envelope stress response protein [Candidatus Sulfomarinibacteraceae bacterium]|nr:Asp23/Gls24 family envelope stress response protein [Candidatus Sulfomarinibacteraceae bacterium]
MSEENESIGRIEIAPEVLITIVRKALLDIKGVRTTAPIPSDVAHLFKRSPRNDGVVLHYKNHRLTFDVYVYMDPNVNLRETSRAIQVAVVEAIDKMVGIPVDAVNVHVEDVVYNQGQTA